MKSEVRTRWICLNWFSTDFCFTVFDIFLVYFWAMLYMIYAEPFWYFISVIDDELTGLNLWLNQEYRTCKIQILKRQGQALMQNNIQIPLFQVKFIPHKLKNTPIINKTEWLNSFQVSGPRRLDNPWRVVIYWAILNVYSCVGFICIQLFTVVSAFEHFLDLDIGQSR